MTRTLAMCLVGESGTVRQISGDTIVGQRLCEMGLTPGTPFEVIRFAPLGDPIEIELLGFRLSVRKSEASLVEIL